MNKRVLATLSPLLLIALLVGACGGGADPTPTQKPAPTDTPTSTSVAPSPTDGEGGIPVNVINHTNPYVFEPNEFDFKVGTTYTLTIVGEDEFHTFTVKDLDIDIFVNAGETVVVDITPNKVGTFRLVCVPHLGLGMVGEVRVS